MKKMLLIFTFFGHVGCGMKRDLPKKECSKNNQVNNDETKASSLVTSHATIQACILNTQTKSNNPVLLEKSEQKTFLASIWGGNPKT